MNEKYLVDTNAGANIRISCLNKLANELEGEPRRHISSKNGVTS